MRPGRPGADPLRLGGVRGSDLGQPVVRFARPGLRGVQVRGHLPGRLVRCGARVVGGRGAALSIGTGSLGSSGALLSRRPCGLDFGLGGGRVAQRGCGLGRRAPSAVSLSARARISCSKPDPRS